MRKNAVNRELTPLIGGVCAVAGFQASGVYCGISERLDRREDLGAIYSDKRCPTACVFASGNRQGAPVSVSRKHIKDGLAQAVVFNSGKANVFAFAGEKTAETVCKTLGNALKVDERDVIIASTGEVTESFDGAKLCAGIPELVNSLSALPQGSLAAARALMTTDTQVKELAYSFEIGDCVCRIGAVFKGSRRVCPNMATTLAFLVTDVNITSEMLQKALSAEVKETLNMLNKDGVSSPNDTVCIMANGKAGNWRIATLDTEYKKFTFALRKVLEEMSRTIAADGANIELICKVGGAISKQEARETAKRLVGLSAIKDAIRKGMLEKESFFYALENVRYDVAALRIALCLDGKNVVLCETGRFNLGIEQAFGDMAQTKRVEILLELGCGNYGATAYGQV